MPASFRNARLGVSLEEFDRAFPEAEPFVPEVEGLFLSEEEGGRVLPLSDPTFEKAFFAFTDPDRDLISEGRFLFRIIARFREDVSAGRSFRDLLRALSRKYDPVSEESRLLSKRNHLWRDSRVNLALYGTKETYGDGFPYLAQGSGGETGGDLPGALLGLEVERKKGMVYFLILEDRQYLERVERKMKELIRRESGWERRR